MDYVAHYSRLMECAKERSLRGYFERHHIVPKCLGGSRAKENIVCLTPEEHYIAHQLLVKIYPGNHRLLWAAVSMTNQTGVMRRSNKLYGWLRRRFSEMMREQHTGRHPSKATLQKMREARLGKHFGPHSEETKRKMSMAAKGKPKSLAHRQAMSKSRKGRSPAPRTEEWLKNMSRGIRVAFASHDFAERKTEKYRANQSAQMKRIWKERKEG